MFEDLLKLRKPGFGMDTEVLTSSPVGLSQLCVTLTFTGSAWYFTSCDADVKARIRKY